MEDRTDNEQHLRLLAIFHYVVAGFTALFALLPLIHFALGWFLIHAPPPKQGEPPPEFVGWIFMGFGASFFLLGEFSQLASLLPDGVSTRVHIIGSFS